MNKKESFGEKIYTTDFKTPIWVGFIIWVILIGGSMGYLWVKGNNMALEWEKNRDMIIYLTLSIAILIVVFPIITWQRIKLDTGKGRLKIIKSLDLLFSREKSLSLAEVESMETKQKPKIGRILYLGMQNGKKYRINLTTLKRGTELEKQLDRFVAEPKGRDDE